MNMEAVTDEEEQDNCSRWEEIINKKFASIGQKPFCANFQLLQNLEKELKHGQFERDFKQFLSTVSSTVKHRDLNFILNEYHRGEGTDIVYFGLHHLSTIEKQREPTWKEILLALCKIERLDILNNLQPEIEEWVNTLKKSERAQENQCCCNDITKSKETQQQQQQQQQTQNSFMYLPCYQYYPYNQPYFYYPYTGSWSVPYASTETSSMQSTQFPSYSFCNSVPNNPSRNNFNTGTTDIAGDFNTGINGRNLVHGDKVNVFLTYSEDGNSIAEHLHKKLESNGIQVFNEDYYFEIDPELQLAEKIPVLMKEVDYIVPILTEQYLKDIAAANKNGDRSINVRALYSYYLNHYVNNGCRNSKVRPVCTQEYSTVFVDKRKELTPCLSMPHKLWDGINMFIGVLKKMPGKST